MTIISPQKEYWPSLGSNQQSPILKSCTQLTVLHRVSRVKVQICLVMESKHGIHGRKYWLPAFSVFCQYVFFISIFPTTIFDLSKTESSPKLHSIWYRSSPQDLYAFNMGESKFNCGLIQSEQMVNSMMWVLTQDHSYGWLWNNRTFYYQSFHLSSPYALLSSISMGPLSSITLTVHSADFQENF